MRTRSMAKRVLGIHAILCLSITVLLLAFVREAKAQNQGSRSETITAGTITPGTYTTESGWGNLRISKTTAGTTAFDVQTTTGEDVCHIQGAVANGEGSATDSENGDVCKIKFTKTNKGIDIVADTPKECRGFCGANGGFKGLYLTVPEGCLAAQIDKTRSDFKKLYIKKDYKVALTILQSVLQNCVNTLNFVDLGDIRNDIAITQYKNGLHNECLKTLDPYVIDTKRKDSAVINDWPPNQAEEYLKIVKASRTNIRLCAE